MEKFGKCHVSISAGQASICVVLFVCGGNRLSLVWSSPIELHKYETHILPQGTVRKIGETLLLFAKPLVCCLEDVEGLHK